MSTVVGGADGDADAPGAEELLAACAQAETAARDKAAVNNRDVTFMGLLLLLRGRKNLFA